MLELTDTNKGSVDVNEMKEGDVAVITNWTYPGAIGAIVQRYRANLIRLGRPWGNSWSGFFEGGSLRGCRVRILEDGETLAVRVDQ